MMHINFRHVVALSIYSELTDDDSAIDALNWARLAKWTQTALAANAGPGSMSAPSFPKTLRPGKRIVITTREASFWRTASI